jgi:asparagine synthase (glutamine-hydrolysing)
MSMAVGLEVRVPFCDHRLVEYVYNTPWALKTYDGREKSLLRGAVRDDLPDTVVQRVKSTYPSTQDWHYALDLQMQGRALLRQPAHPVFEIVDRIWLEGATRSDPRAIPVGDRQGLEWTLNLATWQEVYRPRLML